MQIKFTLVKRSFLLSVGLLAVAPTYAQTLTQAIQHAINTNPDVLYASANRFAASERLKQSKAGFLPVVELRAGIGRERTNNPTADAVNQSSSGITLTRREAEAVLTQNLFAGGQNVGEVERTRSHLIGESYEIMAKANDIALEAAEKYTDILKYSRLLALAKENLAEHKRIAGMLKDRSESGVGRQADVTQSQGRLNQARANVLAERGELLDAKSNFNRVVGEEASHLRLPNNPGRAIPKTLTQALRIAHMNHPAVKAITADVAAHEAQHKVAVGDLLPRVDLVVGASRNNNLDGVRGRNHDEYVMVRGRYVLFRGGATMARIRETAYETQKANEVRNRTLAQLDEHVRLSFEGMRTVEQRLSFLKNHRDDAARALAAYTEQFKVGRRTLLDLLDSQNEFYLSNVEYHKARYDLIAQRYRVLNSMGNVLQYFHVHIPVEATVPEEPIHTVL